MNALLPIDKAVGIAAAQEYHYMVRGVKGLCVLMLAVAAVVLFLWRQGYFA